MAGDVHHLCRRILVCCERCGERDVERVRCGYRERAYWRSYNGGGVMIFPARKAERAGEKIRALNLPQPARVEADDVGMPWAVISHGQRQEIEEIVDVWRIDDEWWREPLLRRYFLVVLHGGVLRTLFQDLLSGQWYEQRY